MPLVLRKVTWSSNCLLKVKLISYLKPFNYVQTNKNNYLKTYTWNYISVCKLFVLERNTWYAKNSFERITQKM